MLQTIQDYFLPAYVERALKEASRFQVATVRYDDRFTLRHLEVDRQTLAIIGRELRRRRSVLLADVDPADRQSLGRRLTGLRSLLAEAGRADAAIRKEALQILPHISGFSVEMVRILLDSVAALMADENGPGGTLPSNEAAVRFVETPGGYARYYSGGWGVSVPRILSIGQRCRRLPVQPLPLTGFPEVVTNVAAGNVPGIAVMEALLAVMVGAASLGKNASAEPYFGPRFFQELARLESESGSFPLSDLVALVTFPGTEYALLEEMVRQGDHLQATGGLDSQQVIGWLVRRQRWGSLRGLKRRVSGHWHKVSFDIVANDYLCSEWEDTVAFNVAFDNSMYDTQGCLSAQQVFVEGSEIQVLRFAEMFVEHMKRILSGLPKGAQPHERLRQMYEWYERKQDVVILTTLRDMRAAPFFVAVDRRTKEFAVYNALNRSIVIRCVERLETDLPRLLGSGEKRDVLQSCGVAIPPDRLMGIAESLGRAGVNRIVAAGNIWNMRLGVEAWDGYLSPIDLIAPQLGYWTTIAFRDANQDLTRVKARNLALLNGNND